MARCTRCTKNSGKFQQLAQATVSLRDKEIDFENDDDFKLITFNSAGTYTRIVTSPTKVLSEYGLKNYGMRKPGRQFYVHVLDIEHSPHLFTVVVPETPSYSNTLKYLAEQGEINFEDIPRFEEKVLQLISEGKLDSADSNTQYKLEYFLQLINTPEEIQSESVEKIDITENPPIRNSVPHTAFASQHEVHHLKVFNAYKKGILEGFENPDDEGKVYIYEDQTLPE